MEAEMIIMELVANSGNARSMAIEALRLARQGEFVQAEQKLAEADQILLKAHECQTDLIQRELNGNPVTLNLLMVHAQDHLMCALVVMDLIKEMIEDKKQMAERSTENA